jgi:aminoglycoside 2''-phosphotransferase
MDETGALAGYIELLLTGFPTLQVDHCTCLGEGWDSVALLVNGQDVFRLAKRPDAAVRQAREAALLPLLEARLPVPIPRYTATWHDPAWPGLRIVGYRLLPGNPLMASIPRRSSHANQPGSSLTATQVQQAEELGAFLRALHAVPVEVARRHGAMGSDDAAGRREAYRSFFATIRAEMAPLFTAQEQAAILAFWSRYLEDDTCFAFIPTLVHRDLITEHVLWNPTTGSLTGVIDWGDAGIDDPAVDFAGLRRQLGEAFARQMLAAYVSDSPRDMTMTTMLHRMDFYAGMEPFHEIHFGQANGDAAHLAHGIAWVRRQCREM